MNKLLIALEQNDKDGYCVNILDAIRWVPSSWDAVTQFVSQSWFRER